mmetsp:Transcript_42954/g.129750  ORF Transcript_42954/g.129750 Transcript_42954/m.129750 type:complete len:241 (-) Transcript_42954:60-782(-)
MVRPFVVVVWADVPSWCDAPGDGLATARCRQPRCARSGGGDICAFVARLRAARPPADVAAGVRLRGCIPRLRLAPRARLCRLRGAAGLGPAARHADVATPRAGVGRRGGQVQNGACPVPEEHRAGGVLRRGGRRAARGRAPPGRPAARHGGRGVGVAALPHDQHVCHAGGLAAVHPDHGRVGASDLEAHECLGNRRRHDRRHRDYEPLWFSFHHGDELHGRCRRLRREVRCDRKPGAEAR